MRALAQAAEALGPVVQVAHTAGLSPEQASQEAILAVDLVGVSLMIDEFENVIAPGVPASSSRVWPALWPLDH